MQTFCWLLSAFIVTFPQYEGGGTEGGETQVSSPAPTTMAYNKFAQIYRNRFASEMFQVETKNSPPSLTKISPQVDLIR